jgi:hypothetical protein
MARKKKPATAAEADPSKVESAAAAAFPPDSVTPVAPPNSDTPAIKDGRGRPSNYDPAWCDLVIAYGSEGMSRAEISLELKIGRKSLYRYMEAHEEFREAMEEAEWLAKAWWERLGRWGVERGIKDSWSPPTYAFIMKNRFKDTYSDSQKVEHDLGKGFLQFLDAARKGELKTPAPSYPKAAA